MLCYAGFPGKCIFSLAPDFSPVLEVSPTASSNRFNGFFQGLAYKNMEFNALWPPACFKLDESLVFSCKKQPKMVEFNYFRSKC